jgi:tRNA nucleotidyltransferase (CCA-adding enzyme)
MRREKKPMAKLKAEFRDKALFVSLFGEDVYAVGGYVRDLIKGKPSEEVDILILHHPQGEIIKRLEARGRVDLVGKSFGIVKFTREGRTYDVALPRKDFARGAGVKSHKDFLIDSDPDLPIERDLERRDFRCNSMALRLSDGRLIDPFDGQSDTRAKLIRLTNPRAFPDDPLRVLRVARFASVLGFTVDTSIYQVAKEIDLKGLSVERINEELFKILLLSSRPSVGLEELFKVGALEQLFPELYALTLCIQDSLFHPETDAFGHHTVWPHVKLTVDQAKRLAEQTGLDQGKKLCLLLAALYHDLGKPDTARWEFKRGRMTITNNGHDIRSERIAKRIFCRSRIFTWGGFNLRKMVPLLIRTHHRASELWQNRQAVTKKAFNRLAADVAGEIELLVCLDAADRAGRKAVPIKGFDREARWLLGKCQELRVSKDTIKPIIMGRDLIKMGLSPGPAMGKILKRLYRLQLDGLFENRAQGLQAASKMLGGGKR